MKKPKLITGFQAAHFERLVSCKYHNRFIEVKFRGNAGRIYEFPVDWVSVKRIEAGVFTILLHDWCNGLERAERMFNPFYL